MSIQAINWVLEYHPSEGARRLVMLALANHANDRGECWPSVATIAREARLHPTYVQKMLSELDAEGFIGRDINAAPDNRIPGNKRPNLYRLQPIRGQESLTPWVDRGQELDAQGSRVTPFRGQEDIDPNHQENHKEPGERFGPKGPPSPESKAAIAAARKAVGRAS